MSTREQAGLGGKGSKHHCSLSSKEEHIGRCPQPAVSEMSYTDQVLGVSTTSFSCGPVGGRHRGLTTDWFPTSCPDHKQLGQT